MHTNEFYGERWSLKDLLSLQVRDYIHVVDLADGHIAALRKLDAAGIGNTLNIRLFACGDW